MTTRITVTTGADLSALLAGYANAYETEYGQREAITDLIPHMLEVFITAHRGFRDVQSKLASASKTNLIDIEARDGCMSRCHHSLLARQMTAMRTFETFAEGTAFVEMGGERSFTATAKE